MQTIYRQKNQKCLDCSGTYTTTNKPFVFKSHDWSSNTLIPELAKFVGCRVGTGLLETAAIWLLVDVLIWNGNWVKLAINVFVVVLNYVSSKLLVFKNNKKV